MFENVVFCFPITLVNSTKVIKVKL